MSNNHVRICLDDGEMVSYAVEQLNYEEIQSAAQEHMLIYSNHNPTHSGMRMWYDTAQAANGTSHPQHHVLRSADDVDGMLRHCASVGEQSPAVHVGVADEIVSNLPSPERVEEQLADAPLPMCPPSIEPSPCAARPSERAERDMGQYSGDRPQGPLSQRGRKHWKWKKEKLLGAGSDGKVFLGRLESGDHIAVKEIIVAAEYGGNMAVASKSAQIQDDLSAQYKQARMLQLLPPHENIVQYEGIETSSCALYIFMEYVPGGSISSLLRSLGSFGEKVIRTYANHICTALAHLHRNNIIHRDIKGANCLVGVDKTAKVADFGCCITRAAGVKDKGIHGTSNWMSPECIRSDNVSEKTDIWSLGCTIVEMATAKPPWYEARFTNEWAAMFYISQAGRGPPIPPQLSRQAHHFLAQCFHIDPAKRPSAEECLKHPFLVEPFQEHSLNPEMHPPSKDELSPPHSFPGAHTSDGRCGSPESSDYATTHSSLSFAVIDHEWGGTLSVVDETNDLPMEDGLELPEIDAQGNSMITKTALQSESPHGEPCEVSASPAPSVSQDAIDTFIRQRTSVFALTGDVPSVKSSHVPQTDSEEDFDVVEFGLPEPVMYNVFSYLSASGLCAVSMVSKNIHQLVETGQKEVLWRRLFTAVFGEIDPVRQALRKSWKLYYRDSLTHRNVLLNGRYVFLRRMGHSSNVFEGLDTETDSRVVIKVEAASRRTNTRGGDGTPHSPLKRTPSRSNNASRGSSMASPERLPRRLPSRDREPTPTISPQKANTQRQVPARGHFLPRHKPYLRSTSGLPVSRLSVESLTQVVQPPTPAPPSVFGGTTGSVGGSLPTPTAPFNSSMLPRQRSSGAPWNDLYEYQRTAVPPGPVTAKKERSVLHNEYKMMRHLEAMGVRSINKLLYHSDSDVDGYNVLVSSAGGPSLNELLLYCGNRMSLRTVVQLALAIMQGLEQVHDRDVVHGGLTPSHIIMGTGDRMSEVFFVNFSHGRFFRDPKTHRHTANSSISAGAKMTSQEMMCFCSTFVQLGCSPTPRDDIIAVGHVLCYLIHGGLPWIKESQLSSKQLVAAKRAYMDSLAHVPPIQLHYFLKNAYSLKQNERPDIPYLSALIQKMMNERGWRQDGIYDWTGRVVF